MRSRQILGSFFAVLLLVGVVALSTTTSLAQWGNQTYNTSDNYPNWGGSFNLRQTALNAGYKDGQSAGSKDAGRGGQSNLNDHNEYRSASKDYSSRLGDRGLYQRYYRVAFERGYAEIARNSNNNGGWNNNNNNNNNDGWNNNNNGGWNNNNGTWNNGNNRRRGRQWGQYGSYGGSSTFRQTALNAGYNEGMKQGRKDRNRGPRNLNDFSSYREAKTDFNSRNGNFALHQRYYREGFENGYYDGLNGY